MEPGRPGESMQYDVVLEKNSETGVWIAEAVGIPGAYAQGATRDEALANVREVIRLIKETDGLPAPPHVEFVRVEA